MLLLTRHTANEWLMFENGQGSEPCGLPLWCTIAIESEYWIYRIRTDRQRTNQKKKKREKTPNVLSTEKSEQKWFWNETIVMYGAIKNVYARARRTPTPAQWRPTYTHTHTYKDARAVIESDNIMWPKLSRQMQWKRLAFSTLFLHFLLFQVSNVIGDILFLMRLCHSDTDTDTHTHPIYRCVSSIFLLINWNFKCLSAFFATVPRNETTDQTRTNEWKNE